MVQDPDPARRIIAAQVLGEIGIASFYGPLRPLLADSVRGVRQAALAAAGQVRSPQLWPLVIEHLRQPRDRADAINALAAGGSAVVPALLAALMSPARDELLIAIARVCARMRSLEAADLIAPYVDVPRPEARMYVLRALDQCHYQVRAALQPRIEALLRAEAALVASAVAALVDLQSSPAAKLVRAALEDEIAAARQRVLLLLGCVYDHSTMARVRATLQQASGEQRAYALEVLDLVLEREIKVWLLPALEEGDLATRAQRLAAVFPQTVLPPVARLADLVANAQPWMPWTRACAIVGLVELAPNLISDLPAGQVEVQPALVMETLRWARAMVSGAKDTDPAGPTVVQQADGVQAQGGATMPSTIEKVLILKTVKLFAQTPDPVLADVAGLLEEATFAPGDTIIEKGEPGTSMYIITSGRVQVHDGDRLLNELGDREVFGEMAVLDTAPRIASVTAIEPTHMFRLEQDVLYELMADRPEVVRGIIRVLLGYVRARVQAGTQARVTRGHLN